MVFLHLGRGDLADLDIAHGPCLPASGAKRPVASRYEQQELDPARVERLYQLLGAPPGASALLTPTRSGRGVLYTCSDGFVEALLGLAQRVRAIDTVELPTRNRASQRAQAERVIAPYTEVATRWLAASTWPSGMQVSGLVSVISSASSAASAARSLDQLMYCWYGPAVPLKTPTATRTASHGNGTPRDIDQR